MKIIFRSLVFFSLHLIQGIALAGNDFDDKPWIFFDDYNKIGSFRFKSILIEGNEREVKLGDYIKNIPNQRKKYKLSSYGAYKRYGIDQSIPKEGTWFGYESDYFKLLFLYSGVRVPNFDALSNPLIYGPVLIIWFLFGKNISIAGISSIKIKGDTAVAYPRSHYLGMQKPISDKYILHQ